MARDGSCFRLPAGRTSPSTRYITPQLALDAEQGAMAKEGNATQA